MQEQGRADAYRDAADGRDQRLLVTRQSMEKADGDRLEPAFGALLKIADVAAGTKYARLAGEHDAADRRVCSGFAQRGGHRGIHRLGQGVLLFRAVHPDDTDTAIIGYDHWIGHFPPKSLELGQPAARAAAADIIIGPRRGVDRRKMAIDLCGKR